MNNSGAALVGYEAAQLVVKHWPGKEAYLRSREVINYTTLLVDVPAIMNSVTP
jgi:hypothetical protein